MKNIVIITGLGIMGLTLLIASIVGWFIYTYSFQLPQPKTALEYYTQAESNVKQNKLDLALADLQQAQQLDEGNLELYLLRSDIYIQKNQLTQALTETQIALELQPNSAQAYFKRAAIYQIQQQPFLAFYDYHKVFKNVTEDSPLYPELQTKLKQTHQEIISQTQSMEELIPQLPGLDSGTNSNTAKIRIKNTLPLPLHIIFDETHAEIVPPCYSCSIEYSQKCAANVAVKEYELAPKTYQVVLESMNKPESNFFKAKWQFEANQTYYLCVYATHHQIDNSGKLYYCFVSGPSSLACAFDPKLK